MAKSVKCPHCKNEVGDREQAIKKGTRYFHIDCFKLAEEFKCAYCNKNVKKSEAVHHSSKYYHSECYAMFIKNRDDRAELIDYICCLYKINKPSGMILKQIKDFVEDYGYTYKGITLSLQYFHETLSNPIRKGDGIGIVVYVYEKAKDHYTQVLNAKKSLKKVDGEYVKQKTIHIKSPSIQKNNKNKIIDISSL